MLYNTTIKKGGLYMKRIEIENFILVQSVIDENGDSTWTITEKSSNQIFYIHVFSVSYLNIKIFNGTHIKKAEEAIFALCNYIAIEKNVVPSINIYYTNKSLITTCRKAGFQKVKNVKHLYTFKVKDVLESQNHP